jgi:hypothetical protein
MRTSAPILLSLFAFAPLGMSACGGGGGQTCPHGCPASELSANVVVTTTPAMVVNGVQATLTGPGGTGMMSCQPNFSAVLCAWPSGVALTPGTYSLEVSAPGQQTTTTQVEVTVSPPSCGCTPGSISPSTVSLGPSDGGADAGGSP